MIVECPECKSTGTFEWLGEPDHLGIIAVVNHVMGKKTNKDVMGRERVVDDVEYHFLKLDQIKDLEWFKKWWVEKEQLDKEAMEKMNKEFEDIYWREERERIANEEREYEEQEELKQIREDIDD
jgi:acyl-[acyl carrier protein]--UDP-N-acetylglucosamine O-acyltransferase